MEFDLPSDEESIIAPFYHNHHFPTSNFSSREASIASLPDDTTSNNAIFFPSLSVVRNSSEVSSSEGSSRVMFYIQSRSSFFDSQATLVDTDIGSDSVETLVEGGIDYNF